MTLSTLLISIAVVALLLSLFTGFVLRRIENWPISYLQHFVGALFVFSGWVKAIDPLGTAFKMEQYFAEFESTFDGTWFSFMAPIFPTLSEYAIVFSVGMIVFEIVLGIMLILGSNRKFTSWAFVLLVGFFTFLTGFTYLTGYVPDGVNFFQFGKWGEYVETNMKVTDCGCFGDFLKLEPRTSFLKDVFLLIPGILFLIFNRKMHQLFNPVSRTIITSLAALGLLAYCFSNYVWDLPHTDFRPFKNGVNIATKKAEEAAAAAAVKVIAYEMTNKSTGEVVTLPYEQFMKEFQNYPTEEWEYEQIKSEPAMEATKISDFAIEDQQGNDVTDFLLTTDAYLFMVVAYKLYGDAEQTTVTVRDTSYVQDSVYVGDTLQMLSSISSIEDRTIQKEIYDWEDEYLDAWTDKINPLAAAAKADGIKTFVVTAYAGPNKIQDFKNAIEANYSFFLADDILLKTIVRSNPGVVLMKNGQIIQKWHKSKLPDYEVIKSSYMQ